MYDNKQDTPSLELTPDPNLMLPPPSNTKLNFLVKALFVFVAILTLITPMAYMNLVNPPSEFPARTIVTIPDGTTLDQAAIQLEKNGVISSSFALRSIVIATHSAGGVQAGDYYFEQPLNVWEVARRIAVGDFGLDPIKITIPEGATTYEIAELLEEKLGRFDAITFMQRTSEKEGYLFPDTYFFLPNVTIEEVVDTMERNFFDRITELDTEINSFGKPLHEVITMASLLEKEARTTDSRQMISGILWNRVSVGMPLQVDAVFGYIQGRETFHPNYSDLEVDSPYNTYQHVGLPPGPIANPGLNSIEAAITPTNNDYVFYLTGRDGNMYYSETYAEHLRYKQMYLN